MNDERYDYIAAVKADMEHYLATHYPYLTREKAENMRRWLAVELVTADCVSGYRHGYFANLCDAKNAMRHNIDLYRDAMENITCGFFFPDEMIGEADNADSVIRCYMVTKLIDIVLSKLQETI